MPFEFVRDGIVFPLRVMSLDEAQHYRSQCDQLERDLGGKPRTIDVRQMHLHYRWAYELAVWPRILDIVETVLGPNLLVWATELFAKHAYDPAVSISWHRDRDYTGFDGTLAATAWVALSPSRKENGCMMVKAGPQHRLDDGPETPASYVELQPGEMSLHDGDILHGSNANTSGEKRVGFAIRFVAPAAKPRHGKPPVIVARGSDPYGNFTVVEPPPSVVAPNALNGMKRSARAHFDAILENTELQAIEAKVRKDVFRDVLPRAAGRAIARDDDLLHVLDSMQVLRLTAKIEDAFDIRIDNSELTAENIGTLARLSSLIAAKLRASP